MKKELVSKTRIEKINMRNASEKLVQTTVNFWIVDLYIACDSIQTLTIILYCKAMHLFTVNFDLHIIGENRLNEMNRANEHEFILFINQMC